MAQQPEVRMGSAADLKQQASFGSWLVDPASAEDFHDSLFMRQDALGRAACNDPLSYAYKRLPTTLVGPLTFQLPPT